MRESADHQPLLPPLLPSYCCRQALSRSLAAAPAQLLLAAAACLQPAPGGAHVRHPSQQQAAGGARGAAEGPGSGRGGFTLSGFESSVANQVASSQQLVPGWQLEGYYLESGE